MATHHNCRGFLAPVVPDGPATSPRSAHRPEGWRGGRYAAVLLLVAALVLIASACPAAKVRPVTGPGGRPPIVFAFIQNGITSRSQVLDELGPPPAEFEAGRILAYRLSKDHETAHAFHDTAYSLILVFDERGMLERHALVRVR